MRSLRVLAFIVPFVGLATASPLDLPTEIMTDVGPKFAPTLNIIGESFMKNNFEIDESQIRNRVEAECGERCMPVYANLIGFLQKPEIKTKEQFTWALTKLMENEYQKSQALFSQLDESKSFLGLNSFDSACSSDVSCAQMEIVANKCSFVRSGQLAGYNSMNIQTHVLTIILTFEINQI